MEDLKMKLSKIITLSTGLLMSLGFIAGCNSRGRGNSGSTTHTHQYNYVGEVEATCTVNGMHAHFSCTCGKVFDLSYVETTLEALTITATGHNPDETIWYKGVGTHYHLCLKCGEHLSEERHALIRHDQVNPGHETSGSILYFECAVCHGLFSDEGGYSEVTNTTIPPTGHDAVLTYHAAVPSSCTVQGTKEYYSCSCGQLFADSNGTMKISTPEKLPLANHTPGTTYQSDENTHWHLCVVCGGKCDEHEHTPSSSYSKDQDGHWTTCSVCSRQLPKESHNVVNWIIDKEATKEEEGAKHGNCEVCGYRVDEIIPRKEATPAEAMTAINKISTPVNEFDGYVISEARTIYNSLSNAAKTQVANYEKLEQAEEVYNRDYQFVVNPKSTMPGYHHENQTVTVELNDYLGSVYSLKCRSDLSSDAYKSFSISGLSSYSNTNTSSLAILTYGYSGTVLRLYSTYQRVGSDYTPDDLLGTLYYSSLGTSMLPESLNGWKLFYADLNTTSKFFSTTFAEDYFSIYLPDSFEQTTYISGLYGNGLLKGLHNVGSGLSYGQRTGTIGTDYTQTVIKGSPLYMNSYTSTTDKQYTSNMFDFINTMVKEEGTLGMEIRTYQMALTGAFTASDAFYMFVYASKETTITNMYTVTKTTSGNVLGKMIPSNTVLQVGWNKLALDKDVMNTFFSGEFDNSNHSLTSYYDQLEAGLKLIYSPIFAA